MLILMNKKNRRTIKILIIPSTSKNYTDCYYYR